MTKLKYALCGMLVGMIIMATGAGFSYPGKSVVAQVVDDISFYFDGKKAELSDGYHILAYNGRTYVPARFVAESLGAEVRWQEASRSINITSKECPVKESICPETSEEIVENNEPKADYRSLPQTKMFRNMTVAATVLGKDNNNTKVYIKIDNRGDIPVQLVMSSVSALVDGKRYTHNDTPTFLWDTDWFNNINRDETREGFLIFPRFPDDVKGMILEFEIKYNDGSGRSESLKYEIAF